jgi:hypothetical protein
MTFMLTVLLVNYFIGLTKQFFGVENRHETRPISNRLLGGHKMRCPSFEIAGCFHINPCRPMNKGKADSKMEINQIFLSNFDESC